MVSKKLIEKLNEKRAVIIFEGFFRMGFQFCLSPGLLPMFENLTEDSFIKYYCNLSDQEFKTFLEAEKFLKSSHEGQCLGKIANGNRCKNRSILSNRYGDIFPMSTDDIISIAKCDNLEEFFYCKNHAWQAKNKKES